MRSCRSARSVAVAGDLEAGQDEDADLRVEDGLPVARRDALPGRLGRLVATPRRRRRRRLSPSSGFVCSEGLGVAAEHDVHVVQVAVDPDALGRDDEEVVGGRALLLGAVLGVRADVEDLARPAQLVHARRARRGSRPNSPMISPRFLPVVIMPQPPIECKRTAMACSGRSEGVSAEHDRVGVIDAEDEEALAVGGGPAVLALAVSRWRTRRRRARARAGSRATRGRRRR